MSTKIEVKVPLGIVEYTSEELSQEIADFNMLKEAYLSLLHPGHKGDLDHSPEEYLKFARGMYRDTGFSQDFVDKCFTSYLPRQILEQDIPNSIHSLCIILNVEMQDILRIMVAENIKWEESQDEEFMKERVITWVDVFGLGSGVISEICEQIGNYGSFLHMYEELQKLGKAAGYKSGVFGHPFTEVLPILAQLAMWELTFNL